MIDNKRRKEGKSMSDIHLSDNFRIKFSLAACRKNAGMTLREAAKYLGIGYQTLSKYERDSSQIPVSLVDKASVIYQVPSDYIFLGKNSELIRNIARKRANHEGVEQ